MYLDGDSIIDENILDQICLRRDCARCLDSSRPGYDTLFVHSNFDRSLFQAAFVDKLSCRCRGISFHVNTVTGIRLPEDDASIMILHLHKRGVTSRIERCLGDSVVTRFSDRKIARVTSGIYYALYFTT